MAKNSDNRLAINAELTASVVDLGALKAKLVDASELEHEVDATVPAKKPVDPKDPKVREKRPARKKRKKTSPPSIYEVADRAVYLPIIYDLAEQIPIEVDGPGRPRLHPTFLHMLYLSAASDGRSYAKTDSAFGNDFLWRRLRRFVSDAWLQDPAYDIGAVPVGYSHACRFLDAHAVGHADVLAALYDCYVSFSIDLAHRMAIMDPTQGSYTHPHTSRLFIGDGTVVAPMFTGVPGDRWVDPETGETGYVRHDPNAGWYQTGDKRVVRGSLWAHCQIRSEHENERVNVGFASVPRGRGEASVFMDLVEAVRPHFPHALGYVYDMAMDGDSINRGYKIGLLPITKVSLNKDKLPSSARIMRVTVVGNDGRAEEVELWAYNGALGIETITATTELFVRLDITKVKFAKNADGTQRPYGFYVFPDAAEIKPTLRGARASIRLDQDENDLRRLNKGRPFNRSIYLRPFPEGHPTFTENFGLREDAESFNNLLKQSLWNKRSRSLNADRQFLDLLGFNLNRNIRALMAYEARTGVTLFPEMEHGRPSLAEVTKSLIQALAL